MISLRSYSPIPSVHARRSP
ncbi:hypothetical protein OVA11_03365 [Caulobacter sp. SL161]|nr:hypothetical protein [Caulobacter sp. SL161]MCY1646136.1 hypothetical protein [Caulobacter sp. SL161]